MPVMPGERISVLSVNKVFNAFGRRFIVRGNILPIEINARTESGRFNGNHQFLLLNGQTKGKDIEFNCLVSDTCEGEVCWIPCLGWYKHEDDTVWLEPHDPPVQVTVSPR